MKRLMLISAIALILIVAENSTEKTCLAGTGGGAETLNIHIVFDNYKQNGLESTGLWGFACVITGFEKTILFDTGTPQPDILLDNIRKAGIDPLDIDIVVLSHEHADHVGGLDAFLSVNKNVTVFMPPSFSKGIKEKAAGYGARVVESQPGREVCPGLFTTGEMSGPIPEQAVYFEGKDGLVVITGCAHPGIVEMVAKAKTLSGKTPWMAIGGFHLGSLGEAVVRKIAGDLRGLGTKRVMPTHCTGDRAREVFREEFGADCILGGIGTVISVAVH
jgi:7,8-dihydropterin-6-yl-methyl-4-(beta-D-ribofuranosyl)aminobenzene 5'-phosphate synthase